jgi:hypothetical protein
MYILAHFVCFRSSMWDLRQRLPICYITPGPDGRVNAADASVPEFLFLKRCDNTSGIGLTPYTAYQSVFDYTLGEMSYLSVSDECTMGEGVDSLCGLTERSAYTRTDSVDADASQLTSLGTLELEYHLHINSFIHYEKGLQKPFYRGFALDLANSMRTSTSNKQFRKVLASILPFVCTAVTCALQPIIVAAVDNHFDNHNLRREEPVPDKALTLRQGPSIVHTEPADSRDYDNRMHQHLTVLSRRNIAASTGTGTGRVFIYYYRSRAVKNTLSNRIE